MFHGRERRQHAQKEPNLASSCCPLTLFFQCPLTPSLLCDLHLFRGLWGQTLGEDGLKGLTPECELNGRGDAKKAGWILYILAFLARGSPPFSLGLHAKKSAKRAQRFLALASGEQREKG